ncbi:hypothetical protein [Nannocystis sp.]|nr:hypothetical protein [Nannocystis sp.]
MSGSSSSADDDAKRPDQHPVAPVAHDLDLLDLPEDGAGRWL